MTERETTLKAIVDAIKEMHQDFYLEAQDVAQEMGLGVQALRHLLQEELGISFRGLLNEIRIERAKELTRIGEVTGWKEAALKVGFNDPRYFGRIFKRQEGMTWGDFKERVEIQREVDRMSKIVSYTGGTSGE